MRVLALCLAVGGCGYAPGSFFWRTGFVGERATVGCLDIAVSRAPDSDVGPVLAFDFGNRCMRPTVVDFQHARVEGVTADGRRIALAPYDPDGHVEERELDAELFGHEALAYESADSPLEVCIDLASIAHAPGRQWQCFHRAVAP